VNLTFRKAGQRVRSLATNPKALGSENGNVADQRDFFSTIPGDAELLALWQAGANLDDIATACGTTVVRAAHDMNRVLNKQTIGMDFAKLRERLPP
jgi:hypothetical protein